jgi:hypothetical protein
MHIRSLFVLGGALLLTAANAFAGPKEDVAAATVLPYAVQSVDVHTTTFDAYALRHNRSRFEHRRRHAS